MLAGSTVHTVAVCLAVLISVGYMATAPAGLFPITSEWTTTVWMLGGLMVLLMLMGGPRDGWLEVAWLAAEGPWIAGVLWRSRIALRSEREPEAREGDGS